MRWRCCASSQSISSSCSSSSASLSSQEDDEHSRQQSPNASPSNLIALKAVANGGKRRHQRKKKKTKKGENNDGLGTKLRTLAECSSTNTFSTAVKPTDSIIRRQPEGILKGTHQRTGRPPGRAVQYAEGTNSGIDTAEGQPMLSPQGMADPSSPTCSSPSPPTSFSSNGDPSSFMARRASASQMEQYGPMLLKPCKRALLVLNSFPSSGNIFNKPSCSNSVNDCPLFCNLKQAGWEIDICTSQSALEEVRIRRPVIILLDGITHCSSRRREQFANELLRILKDALVEQSKQLLTTDVEDILFAWLFDERRPNERRLRHMAKQNVTNFLLRSSTDISLCEQFSCLSSRLRAVPALFTVVEEAQQPIKICDERNIVQYVNKAFEMLTGRNRAVLLGSDGATEFGGGAQRNHHRESLPNHIATATIAASATAAVAPSSISWSTSLPPPPHPPIMMVTGTPPIARAESICEENMERHTNSPTFPLNSTRRRSSDWQCIAVPTSSKSHHQYVYVKRGSADAAFFRSNEKGGRSSNAALVDAPITEALNALASIFHRCDEETQIQLREAMRILSSSELYTPTINRFRENDRIASGYYDGLIRLHHPTRQRKRSVVEAYRDHQQRRASSGSCISGLTTLGGGTTSLQQQTLKRQHFHSNGEEEENKEENENNLLENIIFKQKGRRVSAEIFKVLEKEHCWDFDVIELERVTDSHPLANLGFKVFERWSVCEALHCSSDVLHKWLTVIEANYQSGNAYHNATHAADVLQATSYFLSSDPVGQLIQDNHALAALIAATVHDLDHPGRGNAFLMNTRQRLAILYNDHSILENHHVALAFQLTLSQPGVNIFAQMPRDDFVQMRQSVIDMVLATDMSRHFEHLAKFQQLMAILPGNADEEAEQEEEEDRDTNSMIICRMMVKCADIANPTREWRLCHEWALRIVQEYFDQTAEEVERKLPVTMKGFDRETCNVPLTQCTFVDMFARETFTGWCEFAALPHLLTRLEENYERWKAQASDWEPQRNNDNANLLALREKQWRRKSSDKQ